MKAAKRARLMACGTILLAALAVACNVQTVGDERVGKKAPEFTLPDIDGKSVSLSDYKGKVVVLDFWATWCAPCIREIPVFQALQNQYRDRGFEMVAISLDENAADIVPPFIRKKSVGYTNLLGDTRIEELYGPIHGLPTTIVIDREGTIRKHYTGGVLREEIEGAIRELL